LEYLKKRKDDDKIIELDEGVLEKNSERCLEQVLRDFKFDRNIISKCPTSTTPGRGESPPDTNTASSDDTSHNSQNEEIKKTNLSNRENAGSTEQDTDPPLDQMKDEIIKLLKVRGERECEGEWGCDKAQEKKCNFKKNMRRLQRQYFVDTSDRSQWTIDYKDLQGILANERQCLVCS